MCTQLTLQVYRLSVLPPDYNTSPGKQDYDLEWLLSSSPCAHISGYNIHGNTWDVLSFFFFFCLFRVPPIAYGGSQARGRIGAAAAGLRQSHDRYKPHLRVTLQLTAKPDPLTHGSRPGIELESSWILVVWATMGTLRSFFFFLSGI